MFFIFRVSLTFVLLMAITTLFGQGIKFSTGSWDEVKAQAKAENKPIFVDAYTTWCGPCKKMEKEVFTMTNVGNYFNNGFISYQIDTEKGEGVDFATKYNVTAFPTLLYFTSDGELMSKYVGYAGGDQLIKIADNALDPKNQIASITKEYEESPQSLADLVEYSNKLTQQGEAKLAHEVVNEKLEKLSGDEKFSPLSIRLMMRFVTSCESPVFKSVLKNKTKYEKNASGEGVIGNYITRVLRSNGQRIPADSVQSLIRYDSVLNSYSSYVDADNFISMAHYFFYLKGDNEEMKFNAAKDFFDNDRYDDKMAYYLAYFSNMYINEKGEKFEAALRWTKKSVKMDSEDYKNKFVLAQLLFNQGNFEEALSLAKSSLEISKTAKEAGVVKNYFKIQSIPEFIEKIEARLH